MGNISRNVIHEVGGGGGGEREIFKSDWTLTVLAVLKSNQIFIVHDYTMRKNDNSSLTHLFLSFRSRLFSGE